MDIQSSDISKIKAKREEEKQKNKELIEVSRNISEIEIDIKKTDIQLTQGQKEIDNLTAECINLQIERDLQLKKENILQDRIKHLQNMCNKNDARLTTRYEKLSNDINKFIKYNIENGNIKNKIQDFKKGEEDRINAEEEIKLKGEISGLELFLSVQNKILQELNTKL